MSKVGYKIEKSWKSLYMNKPKNQLNNRALNRAINSLKEIIINPTLDINNKNTKQNSN